MTMASFAGEKRTLRGLDGYYFEDTPSMRLLIFLRAITFSQIIDNNKIAAALDGVFAILGPSFEGNIFFYCRGMLFTIADYQRDYNVYGNTIDIGIHHHYYYKEETNKVALRSVLSVDKTNKMNPVIYKTWNEPFEFEVLENTNTETTNLTFNDLASYYEKKMYPTLDVLQKMKDNQIKTSFLLAILVSRRANSRFWLPSELWEMVSEELEDNEDNEDNDD